MAKYLPEQNKPSLVFSKVGQMNTGLFVHRAVCTVCLDTSPEIHSLMPVILLHSACNHLALKLYPKSLFSLILSDYATEMGAECQSSQP